MHATPQTSTSADPRIGQVLQERYRIVRKLGEGGMGAVYEGEHVLIKRRVAIKVLHPQFAQKPEIAARFHREAQAATSIGHPNIIEVTDMGAFPDGTAYMVLEFLEGRDFARDIESQGPQPLGKVVHILSQVCDALASAHAKGIVHRDLKPENVFLVERGGDSNFAKVVDFGISKFQDTEENRSLTQTGTALGTPYYMAPEQCQGKKDVDHRADIYALGVMFFQALTAQYPFDDESYPMLVLKICTEPPPPLARYRPDLPPQIQQVLERMLAKDRNYRFASCAEVKAALAPFRAVNDAPVVATDAPSTSSYGPSALTNVPQTHAPQTPMSNPGMAAAQASTPWPSQPELPRRSKLPLIAGLFAFLLVGGLVVGGIAAFTYGGTGPPVARGETPPRTETPAVSHPPPVEPRQAVADPVPPPPVVPPPVEPVAGPAAGPARRPGRIRLAVPVQGATAELGGTPIALPYEHELPTGRPLHLVVRAPGYEPYDREVDFAISSDLEVPLVPLRSSGRPRTSTSTLPVPGTGGTVPPVTPVEQRTDQRRLQPPPFQPPPPRQPTTRPLADPFGG